MNRLETYVDEVVDRLDCPEQQKQELAEELLDHLKMLKKEYVEIYFSEEEAENHAIAAFGNQMTISEGLQRSLNPFQKVFQIGSWVLFSLYSLILVYRLLIGRIGESWRFDYYNGFWANCNFIPLKNTITYITGIDHYNLNIIIHNTLGNVIIFFPLGFLLPILSRSLRRFKSILLVSFIVSFTIETLQLFLHLGQFDVDDIILNITGGVSGYAILKGCDLLLDIEVFRRVFG